MKHMQDMETGKAAYGDEWLMWNDNIYLRRTIDGVKYIDGPAGRLPEGDENHPWEAEAIAAETQPTNKKEDYLRFKVPTLRNVQYTFPYMHDGRFKTLTEVVKHYNFLGNDKSLPKELAKPMNLSDNDRVDLVLFLKTLTDNEFLLDKRFSFPK